ncbi:Heterokaryon incompatibility protein 6 [Metarhizium rileyi]|uniref:Heterokaryon incompatibility protein 6 n=1 Tax=Metarhizium rileyi (strain RCEF 4871) TaxID=1649241 RepID=A0A167HXG7_METRR|nr:Heterokaryon incompatibility protein 6 [Metarhizium rileyi RCEF 4871]
MELTRDFATTDPADKVFGLFALMSDHDRRAIGPYPQTVEEKKSPKQIAGARPVPYAATGFTKPQTRMIGDGLAMVRDPAVSAFAA